MKKNHVLPFVLSAAALVLASCGGQSSSSAQSSSQASSDASSESSSSVPEESSEYIPNYDYAELYDQPAGFDTITGVAGGTTGATSLVDKSVAEKTKILGALEKYAIDNAVTGMPLFENGGYVMYNPRIVKGTENYITGYGFGIIREGYLKEELVGTTKPTYYHNYEANDPQTINYLDDQGSQVGDLYGNAAAGFFGTKMNAKKNGYDWYGVLSKEDRPVMLDKDGEIAADDSGTSSKWRIYVRCGADDGVMYRTASKKDDRKAYDKKAIELADYINGFKILLCGAFNYYRGAELAGQTGYSGIKGASAYFNASKAGFESEAAAAAWENVAIKSGTDERGSYLDFELLAPTTRFYAMYSLASSLYAPINLDFFKLISENYAHPEFYGSFNTDKTASPVDNFLSTGPYFLEDWETDKAIVFGKNEDWFEVKKDANVYRIPGIYSQVLPAVNTDSNAAIKEFLVGNIDAASIPTDYLSRFKDDPRTTSVPGDSVFKLNLNTCTKEQWVKLFGKNGTISQTAESKYWDVKPWMSNKDFVSGLFYSINRDEFATKNGSISSINYFSSNYMSDPENGISYNTTDEHAAALAGFWGDTVTTGGFSVNLAGQAFSKAIDALIASETIKSGDELGITIWWMYTSHITRYGEDIAKYIQDAFNNSASAKANNVTLKVTNEAVDVWSDVYYKHLMVGQFDLGFGSISGNSLDPLNFMEVLKSDNSSGFTLNWGPDTSALNLEYDNKIWSFDNLWAAADHGVVTYKGQALPPAVVSFGKSEFDDDGNLVITYTYQTAKSYYAEVAAKEDNADAQAIASLSDEVYEINIDYFYVTDWSTAIVALLQDKEGNWVLDDDYEGYISEYGVETEVDAAGKPTGKYTVTFGLTQDLLAVFCGGDIMGVVYFGVEAVQTIYDIESGHESEGMVLAVDMEAYLASAE